MVNHQPLKIEVLAKDFDIPIFVKERDSSNFRPVPIELTRSAPLQDFARDELGFPKPPTQIQQDAIRNLPVEDVIERPKNTVSGYGGSNLKSKNPIEQIVENVQGFNREVEERKAHRNAVRNAGLSTEDFDRAEAGLSPRGSSGATGARQGAGLAFGIYNATQNPVNHVVPGFVDGLVGVERQHTLIDNPAFNKDARETFRGAYEVGEALRNTIGSGFKEVNYAIRGTQDDLKDFWNNRPDFNLPDIPIPKIHFDLPEIEDKRPVNRDFEDPDPEPYRAPYSPPRRKPKDSQQDYTASPGCYVTVVLMRYRSEEFNTNGDPTFIETWQQGINPMWVDSYIADMYGNRTPTGFIPNNVQFENRGGNDSQRWTFNEVTILNEHYPVNEYGVAVVKKGIRVQSLGVGLMSGWKLGDRLELIRPNYFVNNLFGFRVVGISAFCNPSSHPSPLPDNFYPIPDPPPPPKPKKKRQKEPDDMSGCSCFNISRLMQYTVDSLQYTATIPVVSCGQNTAGNWEANVTYKNIVVFANSADTAYAQAAPHLQLAQLMIDQCEAKNSDIKAKLNKIGDIIGIDEFPATLPASLISKDEGFLGNLISNGNASVPNLAKLIAYTFERLDEVIGQFEIPIEVKDSDPNTPGDQPLGIRIPNIAEGIAELMGLSLQTAINGELLTNIATRTLLEAGQIKQLETKAYFQLEALIEYLGFETKETSQKMPLSFKAGEEDLSKMLVESELDIKTIEMSDKTPLSRALTDLLQAAAITRAVHYRKLDANGDLKQQIIDMIKKQVTVADKINKREKVDGKDDFDRFLEDVELGFTNTPGITDALNPYGRNYSERPRIKEIGENQAESS